MEAAEALDRIQRSCMRRAKFNREQTDEYSNFLEMSNWHEGRATAYECVVEMCQELKVSLREGEE